jgi:hypothetical protein
MRPGGNRAPGWVRIYTKGQEIVVESIYLEALVRVGAFAEVGDGLCSGGQVELLDGLLHEADAPAEEAKGCISKCFEIIVADFTHASRSPNVALLSLTAP